MDRRLSPVRSPEPLNKPETTGLKPWQFYLYPPHLGGEFSPPLFESLETEIHPFFKANFGCERDGLLRPVRFSAAPFLLRAFSSSFIIRFSVQWRSYGCLVSDTLVKEFFPFLFFTSFFSRFRRRGTKVALPSPMAS